MTAIPEFEVSIRTVQGDRMRVYVPAENAATARMQVRRLAPSATVLGLRHVWDRQPDGRLTSGSGRFVA